LVCSDGSVKEGKFKNGVFIQWGEEWNVSLNH
jgi:hypothetical protein